MKALLLKDYYVIRKLFWLYLAICLLLQGIPGPGVIFLALYPALLPASAFAYDDRSRWWELAAMMPYSDAQIVMSRYVLGWISIAVFSLLGLAVRVLTAAWFPAFSDAAELGALTDLPTFMALLSASLIFLNVSLPIYFRFDAEKSRAVRLALIAMLCGIQGAGYAVLGITSWDSAERRFVWAYGSAWLLPLAGVLLTALSVRVSLWAYRSRLKRR